MAAIRSLWSCDGKKRSLLSVDALNAHTRFLTAQIVQFLLVVDAFDTHTTFLEARPMQFQTSDIIIFNAALENTPPPVIDRLRMSANATAHK